MEGRRGLNRACFPRRSEASLTECFFVEDLDFVAGPGSLSKEVEAGLERGVVGETADADAVGEFVPAVFFFKAGEHFLELDAVERVVR